MKSIFSRVARGTIWSWAAIAANAVVSFIMSPYIVHHLGNAAYGSWILVNSIVAYLALLDLGMRGAVVKFVASGHGHKDHDEASTAVCSALWFRIWIALTVFSAGILLSTWGVRLFRIPPELMHAVRWAILLNSVTVGLSLLSGIFTGVFTGLQRFDVTSLSSIGQTVLNAIGVFLLLRDGHGIVGMALLQLLLTLANGILLTVLSRKIYPELRLLLRPPSFRSMQAFWKYSFFLFFIAISGQVIYYSDNIVIGRFLPVSAVALYGIGAALTFYLRDIIASASYVFMPIAAELHSRGEYQKLRNMLMRGTQFVLAIALPVEVGLLLRAPTFIRLWMGQQFAVSSGHVTQILTISWFFISANYCSGNIVYGLGKHRIVAGWAMLEAISNLTLSIILIQKMGIIGVAWGTVVPNLVIHAIAWPIYISHLLRVRLLDYLRNAWLRPALSILPFAIGCYLVDRYWQVTHLSTFLFQMIMLLPVAAIGFILCFWREIHPTILPRIEKLRSVLPKALENRAFSKLG